MRRNASPVLSVMVSRYRPLRVRAGEGLGSAVDEGGSSSCVGEQLQRLDAERQRQRQSQSQRRTTTMAMTGSSTSFDFWACNAHGVASRPGHLGLLAANCPGSGAVTGPLVAGTLIAAVAAVAVSGTVDREVVVRAGRRTPDAIPGYCRTNPAGALCVCWSFPRLGVSVSGPRIN